jgi:phytochrome E
VVKILRSFPFGFFDKNGKFVEVFLTANKRTDAGGNVVGCFCFLQIVVPDLRQGLRRMQGRG